ncbi:MAG: hypothetical protein KDC12_02300 [Flavobacteriales bacterium]|nr:hypothetical protein [Flavobacteriales bacterium]
MKEITLKIPDSKLGFFMELVKHLGFEVSEEIEVPDEHKYIVRERIKSANENEMVSWKEGRKGLSYKGKSK